MIKACSFGKLGDHTHTSSKGQSGAPWLFACIMGGEGLLVLRLDQSERPPKKMGASIQSINEIEKEGLDPTQVHGFAGRRLVLLSWTTMRSYGGSDRGVHMGRVVSRAREVRFRRGLRLLRPKDQRRQPRLCACTPNPQTRPASPQTHAISRAVPAAVLLMAARRPAPRFDDAVPSPSLPSHFPRDSTSPSCIRRRGTKTNPPRAHTHARTLTRDRWGG